MESSDELEDFEEELLENVVEKKKVSPLKQRTRRKCHASSASTSSASEEDSLIMNISEENSVESINKNEVDNDEDGEAGDDDIVLPTKDILDDNESEDSDDSDSAASSPEQHSTIVRPIIIPEPEKRNTAISFDNKLSPLPLIDENQFNLELLFYNNAISPNLDMRDSNGFFTTSNPGGFFFGHGPVTTSHQVSIHLFFVNYFFEF